MPGEVSADIFIVTTGVGQEDSTDAVAEGIQNRAKGYVEDLAGIKLVQQFGQVRVAEGVGGSGSCEGG
jgi:hypothetical protein